jgi:hypothetical protein
VPTHDPVGDNDEPAHTIETLTVTLVHGEEAHFSEDGSLDLLRAELSWDECFVDGSLWVASEYDDELALDRAQGENLADRLEAFARQLRPVQAAARSGRGHRHWSSRRRCGVTPDHQTA